MRASYEHAPLEGLWFALLCFALVWFDLVLVCWDLVFGLVRAWVWDLSTTCKAHPPALRPAVLSAGPGGRGNGGCGRIRRSNIKSLQATLRWRGFCFGLVLLWFCLGFDLVWCVEVGFVWAELGFG